MRDRIGIHSIFHCPHVKKDIACGGILVPYKVEFEPRKEAYLTFTHCPDCGNRYKFLLKWNKKPEWIPTMRKLYMRCHFCGAEKENLEILKVSGNTLKIFKARCIACNSKLTKRYRRILVKQLEYEGEIVLDLSDEEGDRESVLSVEDKTADEDDLPDNDEIKILG